MNNTINCINKSVLIISDTHIPYSHKDYILFLKAVKKKYKPDVITHIGDELDYHSISFHDSDSSLLSADMELEKSIVELQEGLHKLFPKMHILTSNHGSLVYRRLRHHGVPVSMLKTLQELYETPRWSWYDDLILKTKAGDVYLCHGKSSAYGRLCKEQMCSAVQGHFHTKFEVTWHRSSRGDRFNAFIGCLVDDESMAFAYARNNLPKAILGVMVIDKNGMPILIKLETDDKNNWTGKI